MESNISNVNLPPTAIRRAGIVPAGPPHALLSAALLILLGVVLQLGALGYGPANPSHFWLISVIIGTAWHTFASHVIAPALGGHAEFWPLLLVVAGLSFLLDRQQIGRPFARVVAGSAARLSGFSSRTNHA